MISVLENVIDVCNLFKNRGFEIYLFNRCVNQILLNKPVIIYNLTTNASLNEIDEIIEDNNLRRLNDSTASIIKSFHIEHNNKIYNIHSYNDFIRYDVGVFSIDKSPLKQFFYNQGFSIDSMAINPYTNELIDYYNGYNDLENKLIRDNENDYTFFKRLPLRLLQMYSLAVEYGFSIDDRMEQEVKKYFFLLEKENPQLLFIELSNIVCNNPQILDRMYRSGALKHLLPELCNLYKIKDKDRYYHGNKGAETTYLCSLAKKKFEQRWAILFNSLKLEEVENILNRFKAIQIDKERILNILKERETVFKNEYDIVKFAAEKGEKNLKDLLNYKEALTNASNYKNSLILKDKYNIENGYYLKLNSKLKKIGMHNNPLKYKHLFKLVNNE